MASIPSSPRVRGHPRLSNARDQRPPRGDFFRAKYLAVIEKKAQIDAARLDELVEAHLVPANLLRADDFDQYFAGRRERLCLLVERAMGKAVPRDIDRGDAAEDSSQFEIAEIAETADEGE